LHSVSGFIAIPEVELGCDIPFDRGAVKELASVPGILRNTQPLLIQGAQGHQGLRVIMFGYGPEEGGGGNVILLDSLALQEVEAQLVKDLKVTLGEG
jgi:hypothetical protein